MKHEKVEMVFKGMGNKKSKRTNRFRSGFNVWHRRYDCPICENQKFPLANFHTDGKKYFCQGKAEAKH